MRTIVATLTVLIATPALADAGHFAEERGHTHWLAFGAMALALVIGGGALAKFRKHRVAAKNAAERKA